MDIFYQLLFDYTLRTVALGAATLGIVSGALGTYAVLRGQSLLGDAISHAALPGIVAAFWLTHSKAPLVLILGAAVAGGAATLVVMAVTKTTRVKFDSALGLMLSVFFGLGLVLLTYVQKHAGAGQAGLDTFLFGQAAALVERDVVVMAILGGASLVIMGLFWKEFKLLAFDPAFGRSLGFPISLLDVLLTMLLVVAIVIGLQTVGVVLMSAMVIAPAAAARQWTNRLGLMTVVSAAFGAVAGVSGAVISSTTVNLPTGPVIVLALGVIMLVSLFLAPKRGLVGRWLQNWRNARRLQLETVLLSLYALGLQHEQLQHPHEEAALNTMGRLVKNPRRSLQRLAEQGLVSREGPRQWALTTRGVKRAQKLAEQQASNGVAPKRLKRPD